MFERKHDMTKLRPFLASLKYCLIKHYSNLWLAESGDVVNPKHNLVVIFANFTSEHVLKEQSDLLEHRHSEARQTRSSRTSRLS